MSTSKGSGTAFDATVSTDPDDHENQAAIAEKEAQIAALRSKVDRQKQHLAAAEKALAEAEQEGV